MMFLDAKRIVRWWVLAGVLIAVVGGCLWAGDVQRAYSDEEILDALQRLTISRDGDSARYRTAKESAEVEEFRRACEPMLKALGKDVTFYYLRLVKREENPIMQYMAAGQALQSFKEFRGQYSADEAKRIKGELRGFYKSSDFTSEEVWEELNAL